MTLSFSITSPSLPKGALNENTQFLYLHRFFFGGVTTFTAHLFYTLGLVHKKNKFLLRPSCKSESILRDFGYGLFYHNISKDSIVSIKYPFLTVVKDDYYDVLLKLNDTRSRLDNIVLVIHDPRDISDIMIPVIRNYKIVTIRKTVQDFLIQKYDLSSLFLYHPFYPYPITISKNPRTDAVSISRIGFGKNIDIILKANRLLNPQQSIKLYGCLTPIYVYRYLGGKNGDFNKFYYGRFERSFSSLSSIIAEAKFVVDLSVVKHDGGGTQYTFLEAIHNGCALILHRRWLEGIADEYKDFKENYNCFAIENENELAELIRKDPDTTKIVNNAKKLMHRHTTVDWAKLIDNN
jgi:hypothetical protein